MTIIQDKTKYLFFETYFKEGNDDLKTGYWAPVCLACRAIHNLKSKYLDSIFEEDREKYICGVHGCNNTADYFYDFNKKEN